MSEEELKPCPYCGGEAVYYDTYRFSVHCLDCKASTAYWNGKEYAIVAWNRRVIDDSVKTILRQLGE